jgi:hypothetical protein
MVDWASSRLLACVFLLYCVLHVGSCRAGYLLMFAKFDRFRRALSSYIFFLLHFRYLFASHFILILQAHPLISSERYQCHADNFLRSYNGRRLSSRSRVACPCLHLLLGKDHASRNWMWLTIQLMVLSLYRVIAHPLSKYPGPLLAKLTYGYAAYHAWRGDIHLEIWRLHQKYGTFTRNCRCLLKFH